ncbi:TfoX/Sxy family protein [Haloglomus litoreum]|uniref:TfoX/Sxy family protein n=1 Tax=Haloglomus litoreum TaxID=3034026 RepID=UPI0023E775FC|nr:TfoX/Sxy family protein [Haloglomus sp. DT116]
MEYFDADAGRELQEAFERAVADWPDVTNRTMFGCPSYLADGTLFAVLVTDGVALTRLPDAERERLAEAFETGSFQAGERTVTKWVQVPVDADGLDALLPYVEASYETALAEAEAEA